MEIQAVAGAASIVVYGVGVGLVAPVVFDWLDGISSSIDMKLRLRGRSRDDGDEAGGSLVARFAGRVRAVVEMLLEEGIVPLSGVACRLLRFAPVVRSVDAVEFALRSRGMAASRSTVCECGIAYLAAHVLLLWLATGSLAFALVASAGVAWLIVTIAARRQEAMRESVAEAFPDALNAIGVYYESGLSLMQAFEQAGLETPGPLGEKLGRVSADMKAGASAEEALEHLRMSSDTRSMAFVAVALEIQQRTGGALKPLLFHAARNVSDSIEMKRFLEVKTSQARLSAKIVSILPVVLFLLMGAIDHDYIDGFFGSGSGIALFVVAVALETLGILAVRRILGVNTGEA